MKDESYTFEEVKVELYDLLELAHYNAALNNRGNISASVAMFTFDGSSDITKAISAAISSMGDRHAPLRHARALVSHWKRNEQEAKNYISSYLHSNQNIPGFGNSFFKESIDPAFSEVYSLYLKYYNKGDEPLERMCKYVNIAVSEKKKREVILYPNAAGITAAIAEFIELPIYHEWTIALKGRIPAWIDLITSNLR